jgi:hypothetical protein
VPGEDLVEARGVVGQILERDGAVLDERDRLTLALHRHHDVEPGLAHLPDVALQGGVGGLDHGVGEAQIAHQLDQAPKLVRELVAVLAGELDQQQRLGPPADEAIERGAEQLDLVRQIHQCAVDQLDRGGAELDDVPRRVHRGVEGGEVAHAENAVRRQRLQVELDLGEEAEGALRAHQEVGHVVPLGGDHVDVVAADPAQKLGEAALDLRGLVRVHRAHRLHQLEIALAAAEPAQVAGHLAELGAGAVGQDGVDSAHVVHHVAVADGARAAGVVAGHAADGGAIRRRDVDGEEQALRLQPGVEVVGDHPGLHLDPARLLVEVNHAVEVAAGVDDQRLADRLPALRGAGAAREHRDARVAGDGDGRLDVARGARHDDADRLDLVDRGVGAVAPARGRVEQHLALELAREARGERRFPGPRAGGARLVARAAHRWRGHQPVAPRALEARCASAAATPSARCGTCARLRPISTPDRVPASIRSLKSPRWPMRNTRSASRPRPLPSDMSK